MTGICQSELPHRFQYTDDISGFRSFGVVRVHIALDDRSLPVQYESSRHGHLPGVVTEKPLKINSEFRVQFAQVVRKSVNQAELFGYLVAGIYQHAEGQVMLFGHLFGIFSQLGGYRNQGCACLFDIGNHFPIFYRRLTLQSDSFYL